MQRFLIPDAEEDFTADPVELFFDLAFVIAFSQLVGRLVISPKIGGMAETALLFLMLWVLWSTFTWGANAVSGNSRRTRLVFLIATAVSVPMAASISTAYGSGGPLFAIPMAIILGMALVLPLWGLDRSTPEFETTFRYSIPNVIAMVLLTVGAFLDGALRMGFWIAGLTVVLAGTVRAGTGDWLVRPGHFAERHGLILIVALGEVIVAIAVAVVAGLSQGDGVSTTTAISLAASGMFVSLLWWAYFDHPQRALEQRAELLVGRDRSRFVRDVYTYYHAPIVAGVVLSAAALERIALHPGESLATGFRAMFVTGLALFLLGIDGAIYRAYRFFPPERVVAVIFVASILVPDLGLPGLATLLGIDVVLFATLVIEHINIERFDAKQTA